MHLTIAMLYFNIANVDSSKWDLIRGMLGDSLIHENLLESNSNRYFS
jgi:hypothetical protein